MGVRLCGTDGGPLLKWYDANGRDMPWRRTREPYPVWVSEIMLQQTQVATALPYYEQWMRELPTLESLAGADEQFVLSLWQGLGYYRRCKLLRRGAQFVLERGMPIDYDEWLEVPGVGPYTAAAIASICFNRTNAVVDGNVERVYARLAGDASSGSELLRNARIWATKQMYAKRPGDWNQAMMELGATICTPRNPRCLQCPVLENCVARHTWRVDELPTRVAKPKPTRLRRLVVVPFDGERFGLRQIPTGQWWENMWEFPWSDDFPRPFESEWLEDLGEIRHTVTNHRLTLDLWLCRRAPREFSDLIWYSREELVRLPMPAPQRKALASAVRELGLSETFGLR